MTSPSHPPAPRPARYRGAISEGFRWLCTLALRLSGWRLRGDWPDYPKAVLLAAPHTSNLDGFVMLATAGCYRVTLRWMGKASLTKGPFGGIIRWLGCVPVDRSSANGMVASMAEAFAAADDLILAIPPEGTRARAEEWKRGYYRIACAASVPIVFSVLDYATKTITVGAKLMPTGDYDADWPLIRAHYASARGRYPAKFFLPD